MRIIGLVITIPVIMVVPFAWSTHKTGAPVAETNIYPRDDFGAENSYLPSQCFACLNSLTKELHDRERILTEALRHPKTVGPIRDQVLIALSDGGAFGDEPLYKGETENLDISKFVKWAKDPNRGGPLNLPLRPQVHNKN